MADTLAREGYAEAAARGCRSHHPQHLPHPRKGRREGLFGARPHPQAQGRGGARWSQRVMVAVAGCVAQAEGEEIVRRAPAGRPRGGSAELSPAAGAVGAGRGRRQGRRHRIPRRGQVRPSRPRLECRDPRPRGHRLRHRAGGLRQVLHLLRGALYARCRGVAAGRQGRRRGRASRSRRGARDHPDRPERQRLSRRRTGRPSDAGRTCARGCCRAGVAAVALYHQPSRRHGCEPHRRPSRPHAADAAASPSGAVGLGPHPRRHEPPPHALPTISGHRAACARRGPTSPSPRISSSAFPARARRISAIRCALVEEVGYAGRFRSNIRRGPAPPRPSATTRSRKRSKSNASPGCRRRSTATRMRSTRPAPDGASRCLFEKPAASARAVRRAIALFAAGAGHGAVIIDR